MTTHLAGLERTCRSAPVTADQLRSLTGPRTALEVSVERRPDPDGGGLSRPDAAWPQRLRRIVRAGLNHWGHPELVDTAELLITELATNALRHGHGDDIGVRAYVFDGQFVIEVTDGSTVRPELRRAGPDDENGRGLLLVDVLTQECGGEWGTTESGICTWCTIPLEGGQPL